MILKSSVITLTRLDLVSFSIIPDFLMPVSYWACKILQFLDQKTQWDFFNLLFPQYIKTAWEKKSPNKNSKNILLGLVGWFVVVDFCLRCFFAYRNAHLNGKWLEFGDRKAALYIYFFSKFYSKKHNWAKVLNTHTHTPEKHNLTTIYMGVNSASLHSGWGHTGRTEVFNTYCPKWQHYGAGGDRDN